MLSGNRQGRIDTKTGSTAAALQTGCNSQLVKWHYSLVFTQNPLTVRALVTSLTFINYHNNWCKSTNNRGIMSTFALGFK